MIFTKQQSTQAQIELFKKLTLQIKTGFSESMIFSNSPASKYYNKQRVSKASQAADLLLQKTDKTHQATFLTEYALIMSLEMNLIGKKDYEFTAYIKTKIDKIIDDKNIIDQIASSINHKRSGVAGSIQSKSRDYIKYTKHDAMTIAQWLFIYNLLQLNGYMSLAYQARIKAIQASINTPITASVAKLDTQYIYAALLEQKMYTQAVQAAKQAYDIGKISRQEYDDKLNFANIFINNKPQQATVEKPHNENSPEAIFDSLIKNKTVAIVGPAPTDETLGQEIDSYDTVVRFNFTGTKNLPPSLAVGKKTNIAYQSQPIMRNLFSDKHRQYIGEVDLITSQESSRKIIKKLKPTGKYRTYDEPLRGVLFQLAENAVQKAIVDILKYSPSKIKIFKTNFYMTTTPYSGDYSGRKDTSDLDGSRLPMAKFQEIASSHDQVAQLNLMRNLKTAGVIQVDNTCDAVLNMTNEQYMARMESIFEFK